MSILVCFFPFSPKRTYTSPCSRSRCRMIPPLHNRLPSALELTPEVALRTVSIDAMREHASQLQKVLDNVSAVGIGFGLLQASGAPCVHLAAKEFYYAGEEIAGAGARY